MVSGKEVELRQSSAMSCLMVVDLICPKCGGPVVWCNGGDVIYDFSSQFKATCPSCGYEDWESKFPRDNGRGNPCGSHSPDTTNLEKSDHNY